MPKRGVRLRAGRDQVQRAVSLIEERGKRRLVGGNSLLSALAARVWHEVTDGEGVILDASGNPVVQAKGARKVLP